MAFSFFGKKPAQAPGTTVTQVPMTAIVPNRFQPRKVFTKAAIDELAVTIKQHGLLQPIIVREYEPGQYEIIAGERRFRAMQSLNFEKAPAIVQTMTDDESAAMALIENLQRENLTPIEEAEAYQELMKLNQMTQGQLADQMGKSQSFVANKLRLLKLSDAAQQAIMNGELTERHGRELLKLDDYHQQLLLHEILADRLTVKETAARVDALLAPAEDPNDATTPDTATSAAASPSKAKRKKRKAPLTNDPRMAVSTIRQSVKMIREAGLKVSTKDESNDERYRFVIDIPKREK